MTAIANGRIRAEHTAPHSRLGAEMAANDAKNEFEFNRQMSQWAAGDDKTLARLANEYFGRVPPSRPERGVSLLDTVRRQPWEPAPDEVSYHEAAHLLAAIRLGIPTGSASVNANGGLVTISPAYADRLEDEPDTIPKLATLHAAGAFGAMKYHSDWTRPEKYMSESDARNIGTLQSKWEQLRPGEEWPCPYLAAARIFGDHPVALCMTYCAKYLQLNGELSRQVASTLLADVEAEIAAAG